MTRCVVRFREGYANLRADGMEEHEGIMYVKSGSALIGAFDLGAIDAIYLTGTEPQAKQEADVEV